ncbi:MAG: lysophospholipid acyltransferase family protein [Patescibacteria group bacterium]
MRYSAAKKILLPFFRNKYKEINGLENLPLKRPYLIAINHVDYLDGFFVSLAFEKTKKQDVYFLSKTNNYWWSAATLPIDPNDKTKSLKQAIDYLKSGKIICNFIEGQRNHENNLQEGKTGTVRMALAAQVPVIPIGIISKIHKNYCQAVFDLLSGGHRVIINIGKPLAFERYYSREISRELLSELTGQIMRQIVPLCGKTYPY